MTAANETAVQELVITRVLAAPRELVWQAWTKDEHMMRWGAPHGFVVTHCEGELRVGGAWRSCMKSPAGEELWLGGVYREIAAPEKLVFTHVWDDEDGQPGPETLVTLTFEDKGDKTQMTFRQTGFATASSRDGHEGGWNESFERLDAYLKAFQNGKSEK